jgi:hypothetical protein
MTVPMTAKILFGYAGQDRQPGSHFEAESERDAKLLKVLGRADYRTTAIVAAPLQKSVKPATELPAPAAGEDDPPPPGDIIAPLREEYQRVLGKKPFHGWDADTLREKIAAHAAAPAADVE